eukprot:TRINITY_DN5931_c0_g1_i3.p3 TRINITY_DN5931_c0_g1~~TRINITY_DN5931_c0_g1_i3.p3  ORF type:complete len:131 (-),score=17.10 TRINITY_DN5931_c0_g1_i3:221-613(-)
MAKGKQTGQKKETAAERRARIEANRQSQMYAPYAFGALAVILVLTFLILLITSNSLFGKASTQPQVDANAEFKQQVQDQVQGFTKEQQLKLAEKFKGMSQQEIQEYIQALVQRKINAGEVSKDGDIQLEF